MKACCELRGESGEDCFDPEKNPALKPRDQAGAPRSLVPENYIQRVIQFAKPGLHRHREFDDLRHRLGFGGLPHRLRPELQQHRLASPTTSCKRRRDRRRLEPDRPHLTARSPRPSRPAICGRTIGYAAWASADPGIHFHTTINEWHTTQERPATIRRLAIRARNTCSSTTRRATSPRSTSCTYRQHRDPLASTSRAIEHLVPALDASSSRSR